MSLLAGLHIKRTLDADAKVKAAVGNRIFPIVAVHGVEEYPFIVYEIGGNSQEDTKDGSTDDDVTANVTVVAKGYEELLHLANAVRYAIDGHDADYEEFCIAYQSVNYKDAYLEDIDAYAMDLVFNFKTIDK